MVTRFRRDPKGMFRFIFSILLILAVPIILFSLLSCRVTVEGDPHYQGSGPGPGPRPAHLSRMEGQWLLNTQLTWTGRLEFYWTGNTWTGRVWFDGLNQWEELTDIFLDPRTGRLQFHRPLGNYIFSGTLSGNRIRGMFGSGGAASYSWEARRP